MGQHRVTRSAALGLALAAFAAPMAVAKPVDLRNPDNRVAAGVAQQRHDGSDGGKAGKRHDDPSRDARSPLDDLRSPDARDAAAGRGTFNAPEVTVVKLAPRAPSQGGGIDWGDAGIGAGGLFGAIVLGLASAFAVVHRRRKGLGQPKAATTA